MPKQQEKAFLAYRGKLARQYGKRLPESELDFLALVDWVRRRHSENNLVRPEFPPWKPRFPATPVHAISLPGLSHLTIYLKDESVNPSGTHKDRFAWEVVRLRHAALKEAIKSGNGHPPDYSLISTGNAAMAIGMMFAAFHSPADLRAVVDNGITEKVRKKLEANGVRVYRTDLSHKLLDSDDVLRISHNLGGIDLTRGHFSRVLLPFKYDWLNWEIINLSPDVIIVPYGSGDTLEGLIITLTQIHREEDRSDPRLRVSKEKLHRINLIGVTADMGSVATMLSAAFSPGSTKEEYAMQRANLFEQAKRQPWYKDTLFVVVGDHGFGAPEQLTEMDLFRFHVPLLLIAPGVTEQFGSRREVVGTQVDVVPTIMGRLGGEVRHQCWGRDLLALDERDPGFGIIKPSGSDQTVAMIRGEQILVQPKDLEPRLYRYRLGADASAQRIEDADNAASMLRQLQAYLQVATGSLLANTAGDREREEPETGQKLARAGGGQQVVLPAPGARQPREG